MKKIKDAGWTPPRGAPLPKAKTFTDRKKEANKKACRRPINESDHSG